jgi:hypothetical protein
LTFYSYITPKKLNVKLINVPPTKEIVAESIRQVNSEHLNKFIILFGTVVRTGHVQTRELYKEFECRSCGKRFVCESDVSEFNRFNFPPKCGGKVETKVNPFFKIAKTFMEKIKGGGKDGGGFGPRPEETKTKVNSDFQTTECRSKAFAPIEGTSEYSDY